MSIRTVGSLARLARRSFIAGSGSFTAGGSCKATFVPGCSAETIASYQYSVAGNGARSYHSRYTASSFTYPRVGALVAFVAVACSAYVYTKRPDAASSSQETGPDAASSSQETGEEPVDGFSLRNPGFRWDKFDEYMEGKDDELPEYVDWEEAGAVTPAMNQLRCGVCVAFATVSSVESLYQMKTGKLLRFSPQQLVDCMGYGCGGCSPRQAYLYMCKEGVILDADYPYTGFCGPCHSKSLPVAARINGYFFAYVGGDERELMRAVAKQPVEVTICATFRFLEHKGNCILELEDFAVEPGTFEDHSVLLVGYGTDENGPYWKIKNSWSPAWGDQGFAKLRRGVKDPDGIGGMTVPGSFAIFPVME